MAKIYQFPDNKKSRQDKAAAYQTMPDRELIQNLMDTLVLTYEQRIEELEGYKKEIAKENGAQLKSPRELLKKVKVLQQILTDYGISCNFFRFYTKNDLEIIYYNETSLVYVVEQDNHDQGMTLSTGEFIQQFEGYPFTLNLDQALFNIFDKQTADLRTTIDTLNNTQI